ncbi:MAG: hypothetical protein ABIN91_19465 [Mucilaginibacter sp.]|jgi:hypothetical protein|uniref:hypothetical protein n=1 Tax=Mucilaginibacter sp. TaxID=1882438 RepID=UPI003263DB0D
METNSTDPHVPIIDTFKATMSGVDICILYSLMVKRISKGYNTAEVSFLMGYPDDYIKLKEQLTSIYDVIEINHYVHALEEKSFNGIIFNELNNQEPAEYRIVRTTYTELIRHDMYQANDDLSEELLFSLIEENLSHTRYSSSDERTAKEAAGILQILFDGYLFLEPCTPLELYKRFRGISGSNILDPRYVQAALMDLLKQKGYPRLKRINCKDGCMYIKVLAKV